MIGNQSSSDETLHPLWPVHEGTKRSINNGLRFASGLQVNSCSEAVPSLPHYRLTIAPAHNVCASIKSAWTKKTNKTIFVGHLTLRLPLSPSPAASIVDLTDDPLHALLQPFPSFGRRRLDEPSAVSNRVKVQPLRYLTCAVYCHVSHEKRKRKERKSRWG